MRRTFAFFMAVALLADGCQSVGASGGQAAQGGEKVVPLLKVERPPGLRGVVQRQLDDAEEKLVQLASIWPADKFDWRPAPVLRSFAEILLDVVADNYEIGAHWGMKTPAQQGGEKDNAIAALRVSFKQMRQSIAAMPDNNLERAISPTATVRDALLAAAGQAHEELRWAIEYTRMVGIALPWSAVAKDMHFSCKPIGLLALEIDGTIRLYSHEKYNMQAATAIFTFADESAIQADLLPSGGAYLIGESSDVNKRALDIKSVSVSFQNQLATCWRGIFPPPSLHPPT